jgi:transposase
MGRPSLAPGRYFRLLLIGYFEGLDSERAMAWRTADSFSLRQFLDLELVEAPPDHSTISRTRRLIDVETAPGGLHLDASTSSPKRAW